MLDVVFQMTVLKLPLIVSIVVLNLKMGLAANCGCAIQPLHVRKGAGLHFGLEGTMAIGRCVTVHGDRHTADGYTWVHVDYHGKVRHFMFGCVIAYYLLHILSH